MTQRGKYPTTIFRVSLKAIIKNEKDEVLLVREAGGTWNLPGGGLDHGESDEEGLRRELKEEVSFTGGFTSKPRCILPFFVQAHDWWLLWVVYDLETEARDFMPGPDADEIGFFDPRSFKDSTVRSERLVYKVCVDLEAPFDPSD